MDNWFEDVFLDVDERSLEEPYAEGEGWIPWSSIKWLILLINILLSVMVYFKSQQSKQYTELIENHALNPNKNRVCIVIAHPDDEAMFFAPTIVRLQQMGREIFLICLSTGNFDGLGETRKKELYASCISLGIPQDHVKIIDQPDLQDGPKNVWSANTISALVSDYVSTTKSGSIITFDQHGVSSHPNHIATYYGVL
jgi:hypothetical protein